MTQGVPAPGGQKKWYGGTIESILTNEKYKGSALLQKKFTVDFLTKKQKVNEGEVPQYFVEHSHPPIIDPEEFDMVQAEMVRRKEIGRTYSSSNIFSSRIICSCCGSFYGSKVWHSNSKYRRVIWQCNHKFKNGERCKTPHFYEDDIKKKFVTACKSVLENREDFIAACKQVRDILSDCTAFEKQVTELYAQHDDITKTMQEYMRYVVTNGTATPLNSDLYEAYGKTGTAEFSSNKNKDHSWFVGFAKNAAGKEIAIAVVMENVASGNAYAVPASKQILDTYFSME